MEFDAGRLARMASARSDDYSRLLQGLRRLPDEAVDRLFREAHSRVFECFDCLHCANCCKTISPIITYNDVERMARALRVKPSRVVEQYLEVDCDGDYVFQSAPCPFLMADNCCSIYDSRPRACREYPHTDRKKMRQIFGITLKNASVCPVVYSVLEEIGRKKPNG